MKRLDVERELIGRVLIGDGSSIAEVDIAPEDCLRYGFVLSTMRSHLLSGAPWDVGAIIGKAPGHAAIISEAMAAATTSANVGYYCDLLKAEILAAKRDALTNDAADKIRNGGDPKAELSAAMAEIERLESRYATDTLPKLSDATLAFLRDIETPPAKSASLPTYYKAIDLHIKGLLGGDLCIIAARPSMGKTALALGIIQRQALEGHKVAFFSFEQGGRSVAARLLAGISGESTKTALRSPCDLCPGAREKLLDHAEKALWASDRIFFFERAQQSLSEIASGAKRAVKAGAECLFVDYLQLMRTARKEREDAEISANAEGLKALGKQLGVPVVCLAQLNRQCEIGGRKPRLSDLRGSGGIEQAADFVMFLHCREEDERKTGEKSVIIAKGRDSGTGLGIVHFDAETARFRDQDEVERSW